MTSTKSKNVFVNLGHACEMPDEISEVEKRYPGTGLCDKLRRWRLGIRLVNEKHCKSSAIHLRSHGAIIKEQERQMNYSNFVIHPYSTLRIQWEICMFFICLLQVIVVPIDVAYYRLEKTFPEISSTYWVTTKFTLDLFCCMDIVINFLTGYYDDTRKEFVLNPKKIVRHYLKSTFLRDILTSIPTHLDVFMVMDRQDTPFFILQLISTLKIFRYFTFQQLLKKLCNIYDISFYLRQGFLLVSAVLLYWHILSCLQLFAWGAQRYLKEMKESEEIGNTTDLKGFQVFAESIYHGALLIYTASYGTYLPETNTEFMIITMSWFVSKFIQIYLLARVIEFLKARTSPKQKYSQMVKQLVEFMRHKQLPMFTQKRILQYYEFHFQKSYFREHDIYATISGQLRQEIVMQTCRQLVENVEFFRDLPLNLLIRIVSCLRSEIYLTNDVVVKANTPGNAMYFIASGTVAVYTTSGKEVCHLEDGAHFGEIALVMKDELRVASVIAVEICELYRLDRKDFVKAIHPYPDLLDKIQKIAAERMENTTMLDEHNRREMAAKGL